MTDAAGTAIRGPRRARWPWVVLIVVVVLAGLLCAAELVARAVLPGVVRSLVVEQLSLPADQQLDVEASGILLPQLIGGELDELRIASDEVTIGGITGSAQVTATRIPLGGGELGSARGTVSIDQKQFRGLLERSDFPDAEVTLAAPNATVQADIAVLGREVPLGLTVRPGAQDGDLLLTPVSVSIAGNSVDLQLLGTLIGSAGERLAAPQRVCIADRLPAGITLTGLRIEGTRAVADIRADGRIAVDESLLENGTC
ncbi:DUF2993 domain-containing protein [Microbacterium sp. NPDC058342]|uniref:LmeA family phospholipid-binding protein n=1 Tax=Microbacterium sp. NPDC058342 TaxID=3346454 RepID=UPI0036590E2E